jgi:transcriptional regulator with GAF, ATPase, and Fis domain
MTSTIRSPRRNEVLHALHQGQDGVRVDVHGRWGGSAVLDETDAGSRPATGTVPVPGTVPESARLSQPSELLGKHPVMLEVIRSIRLVAPHHKPVLIEGPTGTGKELVARAIHRLSARSEKPFVALNCAAIPEPLFEAELFGHTRGAFTGAIQRRTGHIEAAKGGTLLLDEIGEMPPSMQAKLLRFVESGELQRLGESRPDRVDVRIVAATNCSLERLMREGAFRTDLYYRLAVFLIRTPSLSEHKEDIPVLVSHFLKKFGGAGITDSAMEKILSHSWPGNVRELENVIDRALVFASSLPKIGAGHGVLVGASDIQYAESPLEH